MKVILLKGQSKYGALRCYIDELAKAFAARGDTTAIVDVSQPEVLGKLDQILAAERPADLVFSFNILGEYGDKAGRSISDLTGAPQVVLYVDFPMQHHGRLSHVPPTTAILTIDPSYVKVIAEIYGPRRFAYVGFCPVAAMGEPQPLPQTAEEFLASRPVEIFCAQSYFTPGPQPWLDFPELIKDVFSEAAEMALAEEWVSPLEALDRCLIAHGLNLADPVLHKELDVVRMQSVLINEWVRKVRREKFFVAAAKVGLPLTVYGDGYEDVLERYRNIDYQGLGDTLATPERMGKARIVINHNSNFGEGLHDRVPSGMLAGAAVATDTSRYYRENYLPGREIALYRWLHLEEDLAGVLALLKDGEALFRMAQAGQQQALSQDRWEHRIDTIVAAGHAAAAASR